MLIVFTALHTGSGVTTAATTFAAAWPGPGTAVVLEADPAGGRLGALLPGDPHTGLVSLARGARTSRRPYRITDHARTLPSGVPVIAAPAAPGAVHEALTATVCDGGTHDALANRDITVIADCGVADPDSAAAPLMSAADVLIVMVRADQIDATTRAQLARVRSWGRQRALLLVGDDPAGKLAGTLGVPVAALWPLDPAAGPAAGGRDPPAARGGGRPAPPPPRGPPHPPHKPPKKPPPPPPPAHEAGDGPSVRARWQCHWRKSFRYVRLARGVRGQA
uniref:hypothetical protein n=1 Tax=Nocardia wallacei TaxID=480035 RepID=UPI002453B58A